MDLEAISEQVSAHLLQVGQSSLKVLAALVAAVLILVVGLYVSRLVGSYAKKILNKISFDEKTSKLGINELCVRFGLGKSPTYIISFVLAWAVIFTPSCWRPKCSTWISSAICSRNFWNLSPRCLCRC